MLFSKVCPRCSHVCSKKDEVCPNCGQVLAQNKNDTQEAEVIKFPEQEATEVVAAQENESAIIEQAMPEGEKQNDDEVVLPKRHKHKRKMKDEPIYTVEADGEYDIDTRDVTFFEGVQDQYTSKDKPKKIKPAWWEIDKWADIILARRKISKEVNKAAKEKPSYISKTKMILLCLFLGWFGAHNYYAKNYRRGIFVSICSVVALTLGALLMDKIIVGEILVSLCEFVTGGLGFIFLFMWVWDLIEIIFNRYKYRQSRLKFISKLNLKTREKLGTKYVNIHDWFVPYEEKKKTRIKQSKLKRV
ncbi:MAG: TM2 domain-containing protein [Clostridia bacterium]|nr:TM2 domain-containing protein [Clostridia bacterium]